jgi:hypothetical protein
VYANSSRTSRVYYRNWLLVQYALDVRGLTYDALLKDTAQEARWSEEMMGWYNGDTLR